MAYSLGSRMSVRAHGRVLALATLFWSGFWVLGLPDYYQQYSLQVMAWFDVLLLLPLLLVFRAVLARISPGHRRSYSLWLAFYFTVPLFIYDWLYCGLYLHHGWRFLLRYWYLSVYYLVPWAVLPLIALRLNRRGAAG